MKLNFDFKHLDYSKSLELYLQDCLEKLVHLFLRESEGCVFVSKTKNEYCVEINIQTPEKYFKAKAVDFDIYIAVDLALERLEKQVLRVRKKNQHHKKAELSKLGKLEQLNPKFEIRSKFRKAA